MSEAEYKLSEEAATAVFQDLIENYDVDFEDIENDQGKEGAKTLRNKLVRAIRKGRLETNLHEDEEKGFQIIQHTKKGQTFTYDEYGSKAAKEHDKAGGRSAGQYAMLGSMSGTGSAVEKMRGADLRLAEHIALLFFI